MRKNVLVISLIMLLCLTGCGKEKPNIERAKTSKNSVICSRTNDLKYSALYDLKAQKEGTYKEGNIISTNVVEKDENLGTLKEEYIYEFNDEGTKVKNIYFIVTTTFTHEDVTDDLIEANKKYLEEAYKKTNQVTNFKIIVEDRTVIRELTVNMNEIGDKSILNITKEELESRTTLQNSYGISSITCKSN